MREDSDLAILREMANLAREYFDERNRPAVSWDGMPSVQEQKYRRERIVDLIDRLSSAPSRGSESDICPASPFSEEDVALVNELRYSAARAKVNVVLELALRICLAALAATPVTEGAAPLVTESAGGTNG